MKFLINGTALIVIAYLTYLVWSVSPTVGVIFGVLTIVNGISNLQINTFLGIAGMVIGAGIIFALTVKGDVVAEDQVPMGDSGAALLHDVPGKEVADEAQDVDL